MSLIIRFYAACLLTAIIMFSMYLSRFQSPPLSPQIIVKGEQSNSSMVTAKHSTPYSTPVIKAMEVVQPIENRCLIPPKGFKAWNQNQITLVYPTVRKNCFRLIAGDKEEREKVNKTIEGWESDSNLIEITSNCSLLRDMFNNTVYISKLEVSFPIAFLFVVYESPEQFLRLLKVLYRPHNVYCIHPDIKSKYYQFFTSIAECFPNIIISKHLFNVTREGNSTVMMAQRSCYTDLIYYSQQQEETEKWRYVINLCGKELPLTSVREMVKKLISMKGTSCVKVSRRGDDEKLNGKLLPYNLTYYKSLTYKHYQSLSSTSCFTTKQL